jgi:hypothetical protein
LDLGFGAWDLGFIPRFLSSEAYASAAGARGIPAEIDYFASGIDTVEDDLEVVGHR